MHKVAAKFYKYYESLLVYYICPLKLFDSHSSNQNISSQWLCPRIRQLIEKKKVSMHDSLKPIYFSLCSPSGDKIQGSLFLTSNQCFWSSWIQADTPPLGVFRFISRPMLWSLSAAGVQPWLVSVSKATEQPNKATSSTGRGLGSLDPGPPSHHCHTSCFLETFWWPPGLRVICVLLHAWLSLFVRVTTPSKQIIPTGWLSGCYFWPLLL